MKTLTSTLQKHSVGLAVCLTQFCLTLWLGFTIGVSSGQKDANFLVELTAERVCPPNENAEAKIDRVLKEAKEMLASGVFDAAPGMPRVRAIRKFRESQQ